MTSSDNNTRFGGNDARRMIRAVRTAALATLLDNGTPYVSLVKTASDAAGQPLMLVSRLAWHTRNLEANARASLLFVAEGVHGDPLARPRVTAIGRCVPCSDDETAGRFLACHPEAAHYARFKDFSYWRLDLERCHAVAGFGRIETFDREAVIVPHGPVEAIARLAPEALAHINAHHRETLAHFAARHHGEATGDWRAVAVDPDGVELSDAKRTHRVDFPHTVASAAELMKALTLLADQARRH